MKKKLLILLATCGLALTACDSFFNQFNIVPTDNSQNAGVKDLENTFINTVDNQIRYVSLNKNTLTTIPEGTFQFRLAITKEGEDPDYTREWENIEWIINAETVLCHKNLDEILDAGKGFLSTVSIGRVDLSSSMGLSRDKINGEEVFAKTKDIADRSKAKGYIVNFGGGISFDAIPFIQKLYPSNDRFETRKVVFHSSNDEKKLKDGILKAMEFETLYLKNKCEYYDRMAAEDQERLKLMAERLETAGSNLVL